MAICKKISNTTEFVIVVSVAFGDPVFGSFLSILEPTSGAQIYEENLRSLLVYEAVIVVALGVFLLIRGWNRHQLGLVFSIRDTGIGIGIAFKSSKAGSTGSSNAFLSIGISSGLRVKLFRWPNK